LTFSDASDIELINSLRSGNQEALAALYDRYGNLVYTVVLRILKRSADAEDLTQDIFLNLKKKEKFDPNRAALSTYLCVMARSRALNSLDRYGSYQRSLQKLKRLFPERTTITPLEKVSLEEQQVTLNQALANLPDQHRKILEMNFYQGYSHAKIAEALNLPLGTVKSQARKGLMELRQQLGEAVQ
jgi:RNA polymerase sigma-70 factor (ECF subfamily)